MTKPELEKKIRETRKAMEAAAKELNFMKAAQLRDTIKLLRRIGKLNFGHMVHTKCFVLYEPNYVFRLDSYK